jgi:hypothetical protein
MSTLDTAIPAFDHLPEVQRLGKNVIQRLSDEWLRTPPARRHNVERIVIEEKAGRPFIADVSIEVLHDPLSDDSEGASVHFPLDELLVYIIDRAIADPEARLRLKQIVRVKRKNSPHAFQRYKTARPRRLHIQCKNPACQTIFETQCTVLPGQTWDGTFDAFTCPRCGQTNPLNPTDFFTVEMPEEKPVEVKNLDDPSVTPFFIIVPWKPQTFALIAPLIGRLNNAEFEGKPAETVLFLGPQASSAMPFGRLHFLHREHSFNKLFREDSGTWEEVRHVPTNKTLYELADFSVLAKLKVETIPQASVTPPPENST